jgi:hypothetical protein
VIGGFVTGQPVFGLTDDDALVRRRHCYAVVVEIEGVYISCDGEALRFSLVPEIPVAIGARLCEPVAIRHPRITQRWKLT